MTLCNTAVVCVYNTWFISILCKARNSNIFARESVPLWGLFLGHFYWQWPFEKRDSVNNNVPLFMLHIDTASMSFGLSSISTTQHAMLYCILRSFQNCLVHVMDHLSKVTAQSSRNKMNPQNLAICFAPVLMMDFSQSQPSATNISEPIQILKYLIEIWPKNQAVL